MPIGGEALTKDVYPVLFCEPYSSRPITSRGTKTLNTAPFLGDLLCLLE